VKIDRSQITTQTKKLDYCYHTVSYIIRNWTGEALTKCHWKAWSYSN